MATTSFTASVTLENDRPAKGAPAIAWAVRPEWLARADRVAEAAAAEAAARDADDGFVASG